MWTGEVLGVDGDSFQQVQIYPRLRGGREEAAGAHDGRSRGPRAMPGRAAVGIVCGPEWAAARGGAVRDVG